MYLGKEQPESDSTDLFGAQIRKSIKEASEVKKDLGMAPISQNFYRPARNFRQYQAARYGSYRPQPYPDRRCNFRGNFQRPNQTFGNSVLSSYKDRSVLNPTQEIEFLGLIINSQYMTFGLPPRKLSKITSSAHALLQDQSHVTPRLIAGICWPGYSGEVSPSQFNIKNSIDSIKPDQRTTREQLGFKNFSNNGGAGRTTVVVAPKSYSTVLNNMRAPESGNRLGFLLNRMGSSVPRCKNRGKVVSTGSQSPYTHKSASATSGHFGSEMFLEAPAYISSPSPRHIM
ncbi:unnamed protein product [Orchesella dallaii]|uniref:Uncharacterized protein n=1 Tax=Orchesella dallaii TaxID=48710 RepID=A0ABP1S1H6_9HEXA